MKDKAIAWLETVMNESGIFYFLPSNTINNYIHCYFKADGTHFCTFYRDAIEKVMEEEND